MTKEKLDSDRINYLIWRYVFPRDPPARFSGTEAFANGSYITGISWNQVRTRRIRCIRPSVRTNHGAPDYRETAARLQKEWNVQHPQELPFAPHVTHHALVSVLNRGLLYNVQEREPEQVRRE
jgi:hypothetical protein